MFDKFKLNIIAFFSSNADVVKAFLAIVIVLSLIILAGKAFGAEKSVYSIDFGFAADLKQKRRQQWGDNPLGVIDIKYCPGALTGRPWKNIVTQNCIGYKHFSSVGLEDDPRDADWFFWQFGMRLEL